MLEVVILLSLLGLGPQFTAAGAASVRRFRPSAIRW